MLGRKLRLPFCGTFCNVHGLRGSCHVRGRAIATLTIESRAGLTNEETGVEKGNSSRPSEEWAALSLTTMWNKTMQSLWRGKAIQVQTVRIVAEWNSQPSQDERRAATWNQVGLIRRTRSNGEEKTVNQDRRAAPLGRNGAGLTLLQRSGRDAQS